MASKSHDLTHGPLVQQIILFSLPLMATNVLQVLFNMSDVAVVGQFQARKRWAQSGLPRFLSRCSPAS